MKKYLDRAIELTNVKFNEEVEKEYSLCLRRMTRKERKKLDEYTIKKFHPEYYHKLKTDLNFRAKVIASYVRYNIEDFHCQHLSDKQMRELNPLIRNAVYTALCDLENGGLLKTYAMQIF